MHKIQSLFDVSGKVAVLTGGGGVLCSAISKSLGQAGSRVAVLDISRDAAQKVVDDIQAQGGEALAIECDVLEKSSLAIAAEQVLACFGGVDILVNGAGGNKKDEQ